MSIKSILFIQKYTFSVKKWVRKKFFSGQEVGQNKESTQMQKTTTQKMK